MDKNKLKNYLIIALVGVIVLFGIFGGRRIKKFQEEIVALKTEKGALESKNKALEVEIQAKIDTIKKKDVRIEELMRLFRIKDKEISVLNGNLQKALAELNGITSDSSYQFLQKVAYNYPGVLKFLFNELQVKGIHSDYLTARSSEKVIPALQSQIDNCKEQFQARDSLAKHLQGLVDLKTEQLSNCELINSDNEGMIEDLTAQRDKERHRKNFWRFSTAAAGGVAVLLAAFGL